MKIKLILGKEEIIEAIKYLAIDELLDKQWHVTKVTLDSQMETAEIEVSDIRDSNAK